MQAVFGDVLLFHRTYKTNSYEKPLVLFVGSSNNHVLDYDHDIYTDVEIIIVDS